MININNLKIENVLWKKDVEYSNVTMGHKYWIENNPNASSCVWWQLFYNKAIDEGEDCEVAMERIRKEFDVQPYDTGFHLKEV